MSSQISSQTSTQPAAASASRGPTAVPALSASAPGAYVFAHGAWVPLPRNNAHVLQTTPQKLTGLLGNFERWEDAAAGKSTAPAKREIAELVFDGSDEVPAAPTIDLVIAYVGPLATISFEQQRRYPELKSYPSMELVPMKTSANGARYAPLFSIAPGFMGFGPARVTDATVEQRAIPPYDGVAVHTATYLRCATPLPAGHYALSCGPGTFELMVE